MFAGMFLERGGAGDVGRGLVTTRLGAHSLSASECVSDGGAMAFAWGRMRNCAWIEGEAKKSGISVELGGGLSGVVLAAYRLWGEDFPSKIEGSVTAALIDVDCQRLVLMRDSMGERNVFYACRASSVAFSDEIDRVLAAPFVDRIVDREGLCEIFAIGPASTPGVTPIKGVKTLEPGCALVADLRSRVVRRYFSLEGDICRDGADTAAKKVRELVEDSVSRTLACDPAIMLSGGLDSSILAYLMKKMGREVRAWSVEYVDNDIYYHPTSFQHDPDGKYAHMVCEDLNAVSEIVSISPDELAASLCRAGKARGIPGMGDIDASLLLFARGMAAKEKCVLSGECADEVFGGYPWFHDEGLLSMDGFAWSGSMQLRERVVSRKIRDEINIREYEAARYHEAVSRKRRLRGVSETENRLRLTHGLCFEWFMPVLQTRACKMCECEGLSVMTPFCDDRLAKYVYSLNWDVKNFMGATKGLLKSAFCDIVPAAIINRRKSPYPKTHHPAYARAVCAQMGEILSDEGQPINQICDADEVARLISRPMDEKAAPWFGQLMTSAQLIAYLIQINAFLRDNRLEIEL